MALRLSKELKAEITTPVTEENRGSSKGFDLTLNPGENYDLDKIVSERDRQNSDEVLVAHVEDRSDSSEELLAHVDDVENQTFDYGKTGELTVDRKEGDRKIKIKSTSVDYKKYLLDGELNSPSTPGWTPLVTGRRPVIIWQEGTQDDRDENLNDTICDKLYKMESLLDEARQNILDLKKDKIESTDTIAVKIEKAEDGDIDVIDKEGDFYEDNYEHLLPTVGAVIDLLDNYIDVNEVSAPIAIE